MTRNKYWRKQKLVQKYITRLKKFPASNYGLWCDNYNQHWTLPYKSTSTPCSLLVYVKENDTIDESLKRKLDLK